MFLAQIARRFPPLAKWADGNRRRLSITSQIGILVIVLMGAIKCGIRLRNTDGVDNISLFDFAMMGLAVIVLHIVTLLIGQTLGRAMRLDRPDWIAVGFAGSQKTLMVGLYVAMQAGGGLLILPMVTYHVTQLLIDTVVADWLVGSRDTG